ncbi:phospholipase A [Helicobacter sp. MIT 05-5294]|uniref:phospholipase A n=1 Tax=Helicobacter sp. MIT 05-5294 TaxID=1548150 RepID=UPI0010FD37A9|nr:phospholipase A [Helicobacter sp. MIT 05-5294]TLD88087.1 porin [Helicobacter sp. MIT 05-5294]
MKLNKILQNIFFVAILASCFWGGDFRNLSKESLSDSLEFKNNEKLKVLILDENMQLLEVLEVNTDQTDQLTLKLPNDKKVYVTFIAPKDEEVANSRISIQSPKNLSKEKIQEGLVSSLKQENLKQNSSVALDTNAVASSEKTLYEGRFERNKFMGGLLGFEPHKFNYILPANISSAKEPNQRKQVETKFQISIKKELFDDLFIRDLDLYFAYTQQSFWQLYDNQNSRPFRESNYEPSLYFSYPLNDYDLFFDRIDFGYLHQSNGGDVSHSRSWDRLFAEGIYSYKNFVMALKAWYRIPESADKDDNPDITRYLGYGELTLGYLWDKHLFSATLRNNLREDNKGSISLDYSYPIYKNLYLYLQFFNGYGESLQDYNNSINRFGIGILFNR